MRGFGRASVNPENILEVFSTDRTDTLVGSAVDLQNLGKEDDLITTSDVSNNATQAIKIAQIAAQTATNARSINETLHGARGQTGTPTSPTKLHIHDHTEQEAMKVLSDIAASEVNKVKNMGIIDHQVEQIDVDVFLQSSAQYMEIAAEILREEGLDALADKLSETANTVKPEQSSEQTALDILDLVGTNVETNTVHALRETLNPEPSLRDRLHTHFYGEDADTLTAD